MTADTDLARIAALQFPGSRVTHVERLTGGVSADVYRLDLTPATGEECSVVVRVHGATHAGHDAEFEFRLLQALHGTGLPVPEPLFVDASRRHLPHPYLGMAFVAGTTALPEEAVDDRIATMAGTLLTIHKTATDTLPTLPLRTDPLPETLDYLPTEEEWRPLRAHLSRMEHTGFSGTPVLLHGDFWPENLIWQNGRIAAVLDWEDAALGDPLSDVACTCLELSYVFGDRGAARFREAYGRSAPLESRRFALWQIYVAAAAQHFMGNWGLPLAREAHMRQTALQTIRDAAAFLMA